MFNSEEFINQISAEIPKDSADELHILVEDVIGWVGKTLEDLNGYSTKDLCHYFIEAAQYRIDDDRNTMKELRCFEQLLAFFKEELDKIDDFILSNRRD